MREDPFRMAFEGGIQRIYLTGLWTLADVERYQQALRATLSGSGELQKMLVDLRDLPIQPSAVAEAMQQAIARSRERMARNQLKVALIQPGSVLNQLQARRVAEPGANLGVFASEADALDWLAAG